MTAKAATEIIFVGGDDAGPEARGAGCWERKDEKAPARYEHQTFYKRGMCGNHHPSDVRGFTTTTFETTRDVFCRFTDIKKISANVYHVHADCMNSHTGIVEEFHTFFELQIINRGLPGLLVTDLPEG